MKESTFNDCKNLNNNKKNQDKMQSWENYIIAIDEHMGGCQNTKVFHWSQQVPLSNITNILHTTVHTLHTLQGPYVVSITADSQLYQRVLMI